MRKILLFAIAGYAIYYFGAQQQRMKDRQGQPPAPAEAVRPAPARPASGLVFGKGGDLSLEGCRKDIGSFCPAESGIKAKVDCLVQNEASLSDECSAVLGGG